MGQSSSSAASWASNLITELTVVLDDAAPVRRIEGLIQGSPPLRWPQLGQPRDSSARIAENAIVGFREWQRNPDTAARGTRDYVLSFLNEECDAAGASRIIDSLSLAERAEFGHRIFTPGPIETVAATIASLPKDGTRREGVEREAKRLVFECLGANGQASVDGIQPDYLGGRSAEQFSKHMAEAVDAWEEQYGPMTRDDARNFVHVFVGANFTESALTKLRREADMPEERSFVHAQKLASIDPKWKEASALSNPLRSYGRVIAPRGASIEVDTSWPVLPRPIEQEAKKAVPVAGPSL